MKKMPSGQSNLPTRLLEAATYPRWVMVPEAKKFAVHIDRDPAVVRNLNQGSIPILRGTIVTG
jgi:hypothetical protein